MIYLCFYEFRHRIRPIFVWGGGLALFAAIYILLAPELLREIQSLKDLDAYKIVGLHLETLEDYIASVVLSYVTFLLGIYGIVVSTETLAGEEDKGTLELLLALPIKRGQILTAKALVLVLVMICILTLSLSGALPALAYIQRRGEVVISSCEFIRALSGAVPLLTTFIMMGLLLGSVCSCRKRAASIMSVIYIITYFSEHIAVIKTNLSPLKYLSLFYYYDTTAYIFREGPEDSLLLWGIAAVLYLLALCFFTKRNIMTGGLLHGRVI